MITRILTAIGIIAAVLPCLIFGGALLEALILFIIVVGTYEYSNLLKVKLPTPLLLIIMLLEIVGLYIPHDLILPYVGLLFLLFMALPVFKEEYTPDFSFLIITFASFFVIVGNAFQEIYAENPMYIWLILFATYACDSFAYFTGRFFGKHKLNERVSPKKTIEGSIGGWAFGLLFALGFWKLMMPQDQFVIALLAGIFLPIFAQVGDLSFSAIKRAYGIKDYGNLLPGHGGVLDRIDSLLFNLICFYLIMMVVGL